jgi:hypothetical protein
MAPVLQCPDCGTKHPLGQVGDAVAFPCRGCGRVLKVPERVQRAAQPVGVAAAGTPAPPPEVGATRALPVVERNPRPAPAPAASPAPAAPRFAPVPVWMRFICWIFAVPLAFLFVFTAARAFGMFSRDELTDLFLATDTSRFWPVVRLLPFVAVVCASMVQGGVLALSRARAKRRGAAAGGRRS